MTDFFPLGDITELITKGTTPSTLGGGFMSSGINFIKVESISDGGVILKEKLAYIDEATHAKLARSILRKDDILFSIAGAIGRTTRVAESVLPANTNQALAIIRVNQSKACVDYVHQCVQGDAFIKTCSDKSVKSAQANVSLGSMAKARLYLPPLAEQRRIAEILRTWDEATETAEAELKAKQGRKRGLTKKLLMPSAEGDGALRMNCWDVYKICELCDVITGSTPSRTNSEYWNGGSIPWFTVDDIRKGGRAIHNTIQHVTEKAVKESSLRLMPADTVLLCCTASVGEYAITRLPITSNQQFNGLVIKSEFKDKLSADFLFNVASTLKEKLKAFCGKTSVDFVSGSNLKSIQIPLPPLAEQRKIAEILQGADSDIETINHRIESLRTQKRGLMQKLLTGEVRVAA